MNNIRYYIDLVEGRIPFRLYHGTSIPAASSIVTEGFMRHYQCDGPPGVSLTRSYNVARNFADDSTLNGEMLSRHDFIPGVRFLFDGNLLKQDHILKWYKWDGVATEQEFRVNGDGFYIQKYLLAIYAKAVDINAWIEEVREEKRQGEDGSANISFLKKLLNHPLRIDR